MNPVLSRKHFILLLLVMHWSILLHFFCLISQSSSFTKDFAHLNAALQPRISEQDQEQSAKDLIRRILPHFQHQFHIEISKNSHDFAHLQNKNGSQVFIQASSGIMATWIFYEYLRKFANAHISWDHQQLNLISLPIVQNFTLNPADLIRFYQNPCLYGYSFAFWSWPDWSKHLDWMALNGINLALASSGQELIWSQVYKSFGISQESLQQNFFTGKAFLPWNRMGNLKAWSGPFNWEDMKKDVELQHQILHRMKSLGMNPAFQHLSFSKIF